LKYFFVSLITFKDQWFKLFFVLNYHKLDEMIKNIFFL
jgi:hypothetical protein